MGNDFSMYCTKKIEDDFPAIPNTDTIDEETRKLMLELSLDKTSRHFTGHADYKRSVVFKPYDRSSKKGDYYIRLENPRNGHRSDRWWVSRKTWESAVPVTDLNEIFSTKNI